MSDRPDPDPKAADRRATIRAALARGEISPAMARALQNVANAPADDSPGDDAQLQGSAPAADAGECRCRDQVKLAPSTNSTATGAT